jgi:acetyl esterase/lipase
MSQALPDDGKVRAPMTLSEALALHSPPPDHRFAYGSSPEQFGELRLPKSRGPHPAAIVLHGGCWRAEYNLNFISCFAAALARKGIASWNLEYRRVGNPGGGWPGTFQDIARGSNYLRKLAHRFELDLNRVIAVGHSAGGHLALWLAAQKRLPGTSSRSSLKPIPLLGVVSLGGISDLLRARQNCSCADVVEKLMGGKVESHPERYRAASPAELLPLGVPQRLIHGAKDASVPLRMSEVYADAARARGDDIRLTILPHAGHFEPIAPDSDAWPSVEKSIRELLDDSRAGTGDG